MIEDAQKLTCMTTMYNSGQLRHGLPLVPVPTPCREQYRRVSAPAHRNQSPRHQIPSSGIPDANYNNFFLQGMYDRIICSDDNTLVK